MPSLACEVEDGRLSGLPFDSTETLDSDHKGQQSAPYLTRGLPTPPCRCTETADLHGATLVHQRSAIIAIAHRIIWSMLSSLSLPTVPLLHSCHPPLLLTERRAPLGGGAYLPQRETPGVLRRHPDGEKKPASVSLLWSSSLIASPRRPPTSAGSGPRDHGHSESLYHGSAARIRRARALSS